LTNSTTFRDKEQVLLELSKALNFSPNSLEANRKGRLSGEQFTGLMGKFATPAFMTVLFAAAPFLIWGTLTAGKQQASFSAGLQIFLGQLMHIGELADDQGKFAVITRVGSLLVSLGLAALFASRVSIGLYFDLLERSVVAKEGRIIAREEQTIRPNGRDPIEKYYFDLKTDRFPVNLAAYRAIETGSVYLLYVLPRSRQLVAMEPKSY
jgi:hypothetical protein